MTRLICVASGKGGVGKTTVAANLGAALNEFGMNTLIIDGNFTTPHLGFHLGVPLYPKTIHDILRGEANIEEAIYVHPSGLKVIPGSISISDLKSTKPEKLTEILLELLGTHDFVILDGAAGLGREPLTGMEATDEVLVVTNPDLPSVTDALKVIKLAEEFGSHILGVVLNRVKNTQHELTVDDVESLLGYPVISMVPEEPKVDESIAAKTPLVLYAPDSRAAIEIKALAAKLAGIEWTPPSVERRGLLARLFGFLRR